MPSEVKLDENSDAVVVYGGIRAEFKADGITIHVRGATITVDNSGGVAAQTASNNSSGPKATHEIGTVESSGKHRGEIYGGIWTRGMGGDNKPIWLSVAAKAMNHFNAGAWAKEQGGSLPTRKQGDYLTSLIDLKILGNKGDGLTGLFNRGNSFPAGYVWLADPSIPGNGLIAWCQRLSDGAQNTIFSRNNELPTLCVRR